MSNARKAHNRAELTGQKFHRLTVLAAAGVNKNHNRQWECLCDCGNRVVTLSARLRSGHTKSCGCLSRDTNTKHGRHRSPEYLIWMQIRARCYNPNAESKYRRYGGRGITVCDRWRESFTNFLADMGERPSPKHSIERRDNDGPYSPENCSWVTWDVQYRNRRQTVWIEFNGEKMCQKDWCRRYGIDEATFAARLKRGWPLERALTERPRAQRGKTQGLLLDMLKGVK